MKPNLIAHSLCRVALGKRPMVMLRGRLGGLVWYWVNGKQRVRKVGNMDGDRWRNDPAFVGSRQASGVFGAAASLSGVVRGGVGAGCAFLGGRNLHTDITAAIQQACMGLRGKAGPARLAVRDWFPAVLGLPFFRPVLPFGLDVETMRCPEGVHGPKLLVTAKGQKVRGTWDVARGMGDEAWGMRINKGTVSDHVGSAARNSPAKRGAAFFRFSVLGVWLSDGMVGEKGFRPRRQDFHGRVVRLVSGIIAADGLEGWTWEVDLLELAGGGIPAGTGFAYCVGVEAVETADAAAEWAGDWDGLLAEAEQAAGISHLAEHSQTRRKFAARLRRELGDRFVGIVGGGLLVGDSAEGDAAPEAGDFSVGVGPDGVLHMWQGVCGMRDLGMEDMELVSLGAISIDSS